jgi:hypothetical protein
VFLKSGDQWKDAGHRDGLRVLDVEPYSEAYFRILDALPELKPYGSAFEQVSVAGARVAVRFQTGGARSLAETDISILVREFRGH